MFWTFCLSLNGPGSIEVVSCALSIKITLLRINKISTLNLWIHATVSALTLRIIWSGSVRCSLQYYPAWYWSRVFTRLVPPTCMVAISVITIPFQLVKVGECGKYSPHQINFRLLLLMALRTIVYLYRYTTEGSRRYSLSLLHQVQCCNVGG